MNTLLSPHNKPSDLRIAIIGIGIIGLTTALELLEQGFQVTVFSEDASHNTNSDAAVALWYAPPKENKPLLHTLCHDSLKCFDELSAIPHSGVTPLSVVHHFSTQEKLDRFKAHNRLNHLKTPTFSYPLHNDFPFHENLNTFLIDPEKYRPFLLEKFHQLGGMFILRTIESLEPLKAIYDVVINCAGWKANTFTQDKTLYPLRGHVLIAKTQTDLNTLPSFSIPSLHAYFIVREKYQDCLIGTTHQKNKTNRSVSNEENRLIEAELIRRVSLFLPTGVTIQAKTMKIGIRSGRSEVCLHHETTLTRGKKTLIIHCYGHGGSGYSASWGSAKRILSILLEEITYLFPSSKQDRFS